MSGRVVWVVSNEDSGDVPEGVLGVFETKAAATLAARAFVEAWPDDAEVQRESWLEFTGPVPLRAVSWVTDSDGALESVTMRPWEVQR